MFKFLLIVVLISYLIYKVGGFLFKMFFMSLYQQQRQSNQRQTETKKEGNVNIEYPSKDSKSNSKGFEGGEYVDYEEIRD